MTIITVKLQKCSRWVTFNKTFTVFWQNVWMLLRQRVCKLLFGFHVDPCQADTTTVVSFVGWIHHARISVMPFGVMWSCRLSCVDVVNLCQSLKKNKSHSHLQVKHIRTNIHCIVNTKWAAIRKMHSLGVCKGAVRVLILRRVDDFCHLEFLKSWACYTSQKYDVSGPPPTLDGTAWSCGRTLDC